MNEAAYLMHFTKQISFYKTFLFIPITRYFYLKYMYLTLGVSVNKYYNYWVKLHSYLVLDSRILCFILFGFTQWSTRSCSDKSHNSPHSNEGTKRTRTPEWCWQRSVLLDGSWNISLGGGKCLQGILLFIHICTIKHK